LKVVRKDQRPGGLNLNDSSSIKENPDRALVRGGGSDQHCGSIGCCVRRRRMGAKALAVKKISETKKAAAA